MSSTHAFALKFTLDCSRIGKFAVSPEGKLDGQKFIPIGAHCLSATDHPRRLISKNISPCYMFAMTGSAMMG